jgi:uncharacterized OB-fold protein
VTELERPYPEPDAVTQPFWDGIAEGRLRLQRCRGCARHVFYPRPVCPHCAGCELDWVDASGRGSVYSLTVVHRPPPGFADTPYVVVLVELAEGPRMLSRLVDAEPGEAAIGQEVEIVIRGEPPLPYVRLRRDPVRAGGAAG